MNSNSNTVTFGSYVTNEGAAEPFKAFVRTASGKFNSTLEWLGHNTGRSRRSTLLHEDFERSHFEPPRRRFSNSTWSYMDSPKSSLQTYSSSDVSTLGSPRGDYEDGCWSRVDHRACSILLLVLLLGVLYAIGQQEHADALKQARDARAMVECLVIGKPSLPTQRPNPHSGVLLYRLDVLVEFRDGSIATAHEHSTDRFCQALSGTAAAKLAMLQAELDLREGSVVSCFPHPGGRPPSLRQPPVLPDTCAPPTLLFDAYAVAGIYVLVGGVPLAVWAFVRCFYRIFERVDKEEDTMPPWAGR